MTKTDHCVFRNENLFCLNCGGEKQIVYPMPVEELLPEIMAFNKLHANCKAGGWQQPVAQWQLSVQDRIFFWLRYGEHGNSSLTLLKAFMNGRPPIPVKFTETHPVDASDLRRCVQLLENVPEAVRGIEHLKQISPHWAVLADNWDSLSNMLTSETKGEMQCGATSKEINRLYQTIPNHESF